MENQEVKNLIRKQQKLIRKYNKIAPIKEPALMLMRRDGTTEIMEGVIQERLEYTHSDGTKRYIILNDNYYKLNYGNDKIKVYFCHEDHAFPLPNKPTIDSKTLTATVDNVLENANKWKAKAIEAKGGLIKAIAWGIVIVIAGVAFYKMVVPQETVRTVTQTVIQNATVFK